MFVLEPHVCRNLQRKEKASELNQGPLEEQPVSAHNCYEPISIAPDLMVLNAQLFFSVERWAFIAYCQCAVSHLGALLTY